MFQCLYSTHEVGNQSISVAMRSRSCKYIYFMFGISLFSGSRPKYFSHCARAVAAELLVYGLGKWVSKILTASFSIHALSASASGIFAAATSCSKVDSIFIPFPSSYMTLWNQQIMQSVLCCCCSRCWIVAILDSAPVQ
jgi:hypothetical protein